MHRRLPWVLLLLTVGLLGLMVPLSVGQEPAFDTLLYGLLALGFGAIGALVVFRTGGHVIGWIFCALGVLGAVVELGEGLAYRSLPSGWIGEWLSSWSWVLDVALIGVVFLLFPTGGLPSRRWRGALWVLGTGCAVAAFGQALSTDNPDSFQDGINPFAVSHPVVSVAFSVGATVLLAGLVLAVGSLVYRYRRADGIERLQIKQLAFAAVVIALFTAIAVPFYQESVLVQAAVAAAFLALPLATGVAILRYRLYDIDRIISRTVSYVLITTILVTVYALVVLVPVAAAGGGNSPEWLIAVGTLVAAVLFRPVRRRTQHAVNRRFNRARFDADQETEVFARRLTRLIDPEEISDELLAVVRRTIQPSRSSLWLKARS